jgi:D-xylose transport system permease protein
MASRAEIAPSRRAWGLQSAGVFYALITIPLIFGTLTTLTNSPGYVGTTNLSNVLDQTVLVGILAIFITVVLISGNFDLSISSTAALSAVVALQLHSLPMAPTLVICLGVGAIIGLINGLIVQYLGVNAFITTLAMATAVRGLVFVASGGTSVTAKLPSFHALSSGRFAVDFAVAVGVGGAVSILLAIWIFVHRTRRGLGLTIGIIGLALILSALVVPHYLELTSAVVILLVLMLAAWVVLRFTVVGRRLYATGSNPEAARLAGVNVDRYRIVAFVLSGAGAAFVGLIFVGRFQAMNPQALTGQELVAITAAILGGTSLFGGVGSVVKSVIGALILTSLSNGMNFMNVDTSWQGVISGFVLVAAAAIYTAGRGNRARLKILFGSRRRSQPSPLPAGSAVEQELVSAGLDRSR